MRWYLAWIILLDVQPTMSNYIFPFSSFFELISKMCSATEHSFKKKLIMALGLKTPVFQVTFKGKVSMEYYEWIYESKKKISDQCWLEVIMKDILVLLLVFKRDTAGVSPFRMLLLFVTLLFVFSRLILAG